MIYVYKMWAFWDGYWTNDSQERREQIDDSEDWYYMDEETFQLQSHFVPEDGNLAGY